MQQVPLLHGRTRIVADRQHAAANHALQGVRRTAIQYLVGAIGDHPGGHGRQLQPVQAEPARQNAQAQRLLPRLEENAVGEGRPGLPAAGVGHGPGAARRPPAQGATLALHAAAAARHPQGEVIQTRLGHAGGVFQPFPGRHAADIVAAPGIRAGFNVHSLIRAILAAGVRAGQVVIGHPFAAGVEVLRLDVQGAAQGVAGKTRRGPRLSSIAISPACRRIGAKVRRPRKARPVDDVRVIVVI